MARLHDKPKGMSKRDAELAMQQVVYSVQGAAGERAGVQLLLDGKRTDQVLGQPASEPLTNADPTTTLSMMNVTTPEEGMVVSGDTLERRGRGERVRGDVPVGDPAGRPGRGQGLRHDRGVLRSCRRGRSASTSPTSPPGTYTFVATNDDPSGGEGFAPDSDSKTFVIE